MWHHFNKKTHKHQPLQILKKKKINFDSKSKKKKKQDQLTAIQTTHGSSPTWTNRNGSATKLLGNPASDTEAQVTTGFATGHAALSSLHTFLCIHPIQKPQKIENSRTEIKKSRDEDRRETYGFDRFEGKRRIAVEDPNRPRTLVVLATSQGRERRRPLVGREGEPREDRSHGSENEKRGEEEDEGWGEEAVVPSPSTPALEAHVAAPDAAAADCRARTHDQLLVEQMVFLMTMVWRRNGGWVWVLEMSSRKGRGR